MVTALVKQLLEAGVHFGHQTQRWNPKMSPYIFGEKNGIYVINLEKTVQCLEDALLFIKETTSKGKYVLFVGTKKQARDIILEEATRCGMFFVNNRWLGGMLTNFATIRRSINRCFELEKMRDSGIFDAMTKKERAGLEKEHSKLYRNLCGIMNMDRLPAAIYVVDSAREEISVNEANRLEIPIVALIDTNSNPDKIDFPIPGNDDAIRSIKLITSMVADTVLEGRKIYMESRPKEEAEGEELLPSVTVDDKITELLPGVDIEVKVADMPKAKKTSVVAKRKRTSRPKGDKEV